MDGSAAEEEAEAIAHADRELRDVVEAAAEIAAVPADAMELELAMELAEAGPEGAPADALGCDAARDDGPSAVADSTSEVPVDPDEPRGGVGRTVSAGGKVVKMHVSHQAALAVIQSRTFHQHSLTIRPETGMSAVPYPSYSRVPKAHAEFELDLLHLAHDSGDTLLEDLEHVLHGTLPIIPARACNLEPSVREELNQSHMCLVIGCPDRVKLGTDHALRLCPWHIRGDVRIRGTEEDMRRCTKCHALRDVREFRHGAGVDGDGGVCKRCSVVDHNRKNPGRAQPVPVHLPVSPQEVESGKDADQSFILDRRAAKQRSDANLQVRPGESLNSPYVAYAFYDKEREGHLHR